MGFFSRLVVESLVNFERKVTNIVKAVRLTFDDLDLVIDPFDLSGVDRILAVVADAVAISIQHFCKAGNRGVV